MSLILLIFRIIIEKKSIQWFNFLIRLKAVAEIIEAMPKIHILPVTIFIIFLLNIYQLMYTEFHKLKSYTFGQLIIIGSGLLAIFVYVRYRQIEELIDRHPDLMKSLDRMNRNSLRLGLHLSVASIIASTLHQIGGPIDDLWAMINFLSGFCCFGLSCAYFWLQARLTDAIHPFIGSQSMARLRSKFTNILIIFFAIFTITGAISQILVIGNQAHLWNLMSTARSCGYISSIFEWILALMSCVHIITFTTEFKSIHLTVERPKISITENDEEMTVCPTQEA